MLAISQSFLFPPHLKHKDSLTFADFKVVRSRDIKNPQLKVSRLVFPHLFELKYHSILTLLTTKQISFSKWNRINTFCVANRYNCKERFKRKILHIHRSLQLSTTFFSISKCRFYFFFKNLISIKWVRLTGFEIIDMHTQTW